MDYALVVVTPKKIVNWITYTDEQKQQILIEINKRNGIVNKPHNMLHKSTMNNLLLILKKQSFPISLILILALARLIPHPPNFTPIVAVAIMSGYFFKNIYLSFATLIISMLLSDLFLGFYENMIYVYISLILTSFIFYKISEKINFKNLFIYGFAGSVLFFIISNFGVWVLGSPGLANVPYERNFYGLIECYILAIPFFPNTFLSTLIFSYPAIYIFKYLPKLYKSKKA